MNESSLEVLSLTFTNPRPNAVHANQTQRLTNKSKYHPKIYSFNNTISLITPDNPEPELITWAIVPEFQANDGEIIIVDTDLNLDNLDAATKFTATALGLKEFQLRLYGNPDLREGGLPKTNVDFNKTVTIKGMFYCVLGREDMMLMMVRPRWPQGSRNPRRQHHDCPG